MFYFKENDSFTKNDFTLANENEYVYMLSEEYSRLLSITPAGQYHMYNLNPNGSVTKNEWVLNPDNMEIAALFENDYVLLKSKPDDPNSLDFRLERWGDSDDVLFSKSLSAESGYNFRP